VNDEIARFNSSYNHFSFHLANAVCFELFVKFLLANRVELKVMFTALNNNELKRGS
jgi:hypothetical protein